MTGYPATVERRMRRLYESLSEKDRRRYAAVEAVKLGHGGVQYVAELFACDPNTIRQGEEDIDQLPHDEAAGRVRKKGGPQAS
jgi:hypothetical protein